MEKYKTIQTVELFCGCVGLSKEQAAARRMTLKAMGGDVYEIMGPVQFKAGEIIGFDEIPKALLPKMEEKAAKDMKEGKIKPARPAERKTANTAKKKAIKKK